MIAQRKVLVPVLHHPKYTQVNVFKDELRIILDTNNTILKDERQFAKYIYDRLGTGIFLVRAWRKGHKGLWNFWYAEIFADNTFCRLKAKDRGNKELRSLSRELVSLEVQYNEAKTLDEKEKIRNDMENVKEDIGFEKEENKEEKKYKKVGPTPYLKAATPVGQRFEFMEY